VTIFTLIICMAYLCNYEKHFEDQCWVDSQKIH